MKNPLAGLAIAAACCLGHAQEPATAAAERSRIAAVRADAQARFATEEKACYSRFAVNDCVEAARVRQREVLAGLRRQELVLNDAERKRRSAEHLRSLEERASEHNQQKAAQQREKSQAAQKEREARAAEKAGRQRERGASRQAAPPKAAPRERAAAGPTPAGAARNAANYKDRMDDAQERKERVLKRSAEHSKPLVKPLPVPP